MLCYDNMSLAAPGWGVNENEPRQRLRRPAIKDALQALVKSGFLRVVYGGAAEGSYLCNHQDVNKIKGEGIQNIDTITLCRHQAHEHSLRLDRSIPARFLKKTNKMVVG